MVFYNFCCIINFIILLYITLPATITVRSCHKLHRHFLQCEIWCVKSKWQAIIICVWYKPLCAVLTWVMKALWNMSHQRPNPMPISKTLLQNFQSSKDTEMAAKHLKSTWAIGATGFRNGTNSLQENSSQMKLWIFKLKKSIAPWLQATCRLASKTDHVNQTCGLTLLETVQ